ncbi:TMV resistance protein N [Prunus yedoensis var. nudiflora]|uniref:TMV resistance protein N n=1 Tax=Prunus yedoensis var. nudiflora TaxID=2094558 RepID=A0A314UXK9_PRUYE|nr:TMV resistance protein N [Prunus yedoensis var. nudiflora]
MSGTADVISFPRDALFSPSVIDEDFSKTDKVMSGTYFLSNRPEEIVVYRWLWFDDFVRDVEDNGSTSRQGEGGKAFNFGWNYVVSFFTMSKKIIWKATPENLRCDGTEGY